MYRCEATSVEGFIQQLAVGYIARGYWFYVACRIPADKDPRVVDIKLVERYGLDLSRWSRARRRRQGEAGVQYLRYRRFFVLIATAGKHSFFEHEPDFRDIRERPIYFAGYSIGCRPGHDGVLHASVRLADGTVQCLRHRLNRAALAPDAAKAGSAFRALRFAPYAPVCRQLLKLLWWVNGRRRTAGLEFVPFAALNLRRRPVSPFAPPTPRAAPVETARVNHRTADDTSRGIP